MLKKSGGAERQALGRSRGGFSGKIHLAAEGLGNPLRLMLTARQCHDLTQTPALMDGLDCHHALADRAYAAQPFIDWLIERQIIPVIAPHQRAKLAREYVSGASSGRMSGEQIQAVSAHLLAL